MRVQVEWLESAVLRGVLCGSQDDRLECMYLGERGTRLGGRPLLARACGMGMCTWRGGRGICPGLGGGFKRKPRPLVVMATPSSTPDFYISAGAESEAPAAARA